MKKFKTESKRLLDMMAHSIYTNTDIFIRELISNASDALDKKRYQALTDTTIDASNLSIRIELDKEKKTLTIHDNGIGMNKEELEENLGTIAQSGSYHFKQGLSSQKDIDIIGQFGVGFYSAFMVADKIEVISKKIKEEQAYRWQSSSAEGYEINETVKKEEGTSITLYLKEDTPEKEYHRYLEEYTLERLIKKYSNFIHYPIVMEVETFQPSEEAGKSQQIREEKIINAITPLWKRSPKEINEEEYQQFYEDNFQDYQKPLKTLHYQVEGNTSYTALLFIPEKAAYNFYTTDYRQGLKLYSHGVFIKDETKELISDHFRFVKGLIDAEDIRLNISREILQEDHQMKALKKSIDKKIANALQKMLNEEREQYEKFFEAFGAQLKYGAYQDYGIHKDSLVDLLLFKSSYQDRYTSLKEYVSRMKEGQTEIYYAVGENIERIKALPQAEKVLEKGYELLYFTENVDEFMTSVILNYEEKAFKSIHKGELDLANEEEKAALQQEKEQASSFLDKLKEVLSDEVSDVRLSTHLKSHPVCLVSDEGLSLEMEKVLLEMKQGGLIKANKILEINKDHPLYHELKKRYEAKENIESYAKILYHQALLIAGLNPENPSEYAHLLNEILLKAIKK